MGQKLREFHPVKWDYLSIHQISTNYCLGSFSRQILDRMISMTKDDPAQKSGFVAVMGKPNVGKSTLINALIGQKITAVSPRPQTTRKRQMGILTLHREGLDAQVILIDTPGLHQPRHQLGELMNREAVKTLEESDVILIVVDGSEPPASDDLLLFDMLRPAKNIQKMILALNKIDLVNQERLNSNQDEFLKYLPLAKASQISATEGTNLKELLTLILDELPYGQPFFPEEQMTDLFERDLAADLIREAALIQLHDEIPHGIAVRIDQYLERNNHGAFIEATLFLERESHKSIVIGKEGRMLKSIGTAARKEIEAMSGRKVYLQLKVKVRKNWRNDNKVLRQFGY
jgi:GTP-binding protein Era